MYNIRHIARVAPVLLAITTTASVPRLGPEQGIDQYHGKVEAIYPACCSWSYQAVGGEEEPFGELVLRCSIGYAKHLLTYPNILQKRGGITSDGINDDADSSSLSDRQTTKGKKKLNATKFLRRIASRSGDEEEDGYESDASTGSNRSTSSSFLRYQNRPVWKSKLMKKFVLQRRGDLSETPVESGTKWPLFDRIYNRQNQLLKKGEEEDEQEDSDIDDDESVASAESNGDCPLAPPAPQWCGEEEDCIDDIDEVGFKAEDVGDGEEQKKGTFGMIRRSLVRAVSSPVAAEKRPDESKEKSKGSVETVGELIEVSSNAPAAEARASPTTIHVSEIRVTNEDSADHVMTTQESGIPTYESPKEQSTQQFPTQKSLLPQSSDQKKASLEENRDISPHSIPRTICYSLRSAIGDGSARQRNSHSLMERRPLRPNGSAVDLSYWSHRGKRNYMEGKNRFGFAQCNHYLFELKIILEALTILPHFRPVYH